MKKALLIILAITTIFAACTSEKFVTSLSVSQTSVSDSIELNSTKSLAVSITNNSENTGSISWEIIEIEALTGNYSLKVEQSVRGNTGSLELAKNASTSFEISFSPTAVGTGVYELILRNEEGSVLKRVRFTITAYTIVVSSNILFTVDQDTVYASIPAGTSAFDAYVKLTNTSADSLNMKWVRANETGSSGIEVTIGDWANIFPSYILSNTGMITENQVVDIKFQIDIPKNTTGSKQMDFLLFVVGDSANTVKTVHLNASVQ